MKLSNLSNSSKGEDSILGDVKGCIHSLGTFSPLLYEILRIVNTYVTLSCCIPTAAHAGTRTRLACAVEQ